MATERITLKLWVSNQIGVDSDCTADYLKAADWQAPNGVTLDANARTLSGEAGATWQAYHSLAAAVADAGHGTDAEGKDID